MDIEKHHKEFVRIRKEYNLEEKADEVAHYLTSHDKIAPKEFAKLFAMKEEDALLFLKFIQRGIEFKEKHIDPHK